MGVDWASDASSRGCPQLSWSAGTVQILLWDFLHIADNSQIGSSTWATTMSESAWLGSIVRKHCLNLGLRTAKGQPHLRFPTVTVPQWLSERQTQETATDREQARNIPLQESELWLGRKWAPSSTVEGQAQLELHCSWKCWPLLHCLNPAQIWSLTAFYIYGYKQGHALAWTLLQPEVNRWAPCKSIHRP